MPHLLAFLHGFPRKEREKGKVNWRGGNCLHLGICRELSDVKCKMVKKKFEDHHASDSPPCCAMLSHSGVSDSLQPLIDHSPPGSFVHGNSPGKNTGVGCHDFLQGIFPTQGSNPDLPHYRRILYHLSHQESPNP